jgi:hypothetical protein
MGNGRPKKPLKMRRESPAIAHNDLLGGRDFELSHVLERE